METLREEIINYITTNNPKLSKEKLKNLSVDALVLIKIQVELEISNKVSK